MKKLIALALMVVCLGTFSIGCTPKEAPKTETPAPAAGSDEAPAPAADEPAADAPAADAPAEEAK